mgnify:CR=1 FL=1
MEKKKRERKAGIGRMLAPSVVSIILCAICLFGTSWAWFTVTQKKTVDPIRTASYTGAVIVNNEAVSAVQSEKGITAYTVSLKANTLYTITIKANGDASTGYYIVCFGGQEYYTKQILKGESITFTANFAEAGDMTIIPQWGTCTVAGDKIEDETKLGNGTKLGNETKATDVTTSEEPDQNADNTTPSGAVSEDGSDSSEGAETAPDTQPDTVNGSSESAGTEGNVVPEAETSDEN